MADGVEAPSPLQRGCTYDKILAALAADADAREVLEWTVSVDSTVARAHQHATTLPRHTGGSVELHQSWRRAG